MQVKKRKRGADDAGDRGHKRQRRSEEPTTVHLPQPTAAENSHSATEIVQFSQGSPPPVTSNRPHMNVNSVPTSGPVFPSKRRNPFGEGGSRKKMKIGRYADVRIYAQRKDLEHTREIQCTLTPDGGLDLANLSQKLKLKGCQVSHLTTPS